VRGLTTNERHNDYNLVVFDPGGTTGWAQFIVDSRAFSRPEHKVLQWMYYWTCGELTGPEHEQLISAQQLIHNAVNYNKPFVNRTEIVAEDFELTQLVGGKNLLAPVRINAVLDWQCRQYGLQLYLQKRQMRTSITRERLALFGFGTGFKKDEFAAMQHGVTWLRRIKQQSLSKPWKLANEMHTNAYWDCACEDGNQCDISHPR
jgi:hypothetical protein